jgi:hypothetical protein
VAGVEGDRLVLSIALCVIVLAGTFVVTRWRVLGGLVVTLTVGYGFGIARAHLAQAASYFLFDAALAGLYLGVLFHGLSFPARGLLRWFVVLLVWPFVILAFPSQDVLVEVVGLRAAVFMLPLMLIATRLEPEQVRRLAVWVAVLNVLAFAVAGAEFYFGVNAFYPENEATTIIFQSHDVAEFTEYRIPATFSSAHAYGGTMVAGLPLLIGAWAARQRRRGTVGVVLLAGIFASVVGVFVAAARVHFLVAAALLLVVTFSGRLRLAAWVGWMMLLGAVGWIVGSEDRLQRFLTLQDPEFLAERLGASINVRFLDLLVEFPFGDGLGSGGTNIPAFLLDRMPPAIGLESEYSRLLLEQGVVGLVLWIAFLGWLLRRGFGLHRAQPDLGRLLCLVCVAAVFASGLVGIGLFVSVPASVFLFVQIGILLRDLPSRPRESRRGQGVPAARRSPLVAGG